MTGTPETAQGILRHHSIGDLRLENGITLPEVRISYETWGTLNEDGDNAILILHALTGDTHVSRGAPPKAPPPMWPGASTSSSDTAPTRCPRSPPPSISPAGRRRAPAPALRSGLVQDRGGRVHPRRLHGAAGILRARAVIRPFPPRVIRIAGQRSGVGGLGELGASGSARRRPAAPQRHVHLQHEDGDETRHRPPCTRGRPPAGRRRDEQEAQRVIAAAAIMYPTKTSLWSRMVVSA